MQTRYKVRKWIKRCGLLIGSILFPFAVSVYGYAFVLDSYNTQVQSYEGQGEISLTDSYDSEVSRLSDFFHDRNAEAVMDQTYQLLTKNEAIRYYEVLPQPIEYIGAFPFSQAVIHGDENCIEQDIDGTLITPIKTMMVNEVFWKDTALQKRITKGVGFEEKEYNRHSNRVVPVILGSQYAKICSLHETFSGYYLGGKEITFQIKGFFKPNTKIILEGQPIILDQYVLAPVMDVSATDSQSYRKMLKLVKCEGYLHYQNKLEYETALLELEKIVEKTGFQYSIPKRELENKNIFGMTSRIALCILFFAILWFIMGMLFLMQEIKQYLRNISVEEQKIRNCIRAIFGKWRQLSVIICRRNCCELASFFGLPAGDSNGT